MRSTNHVLCKRRNHLRFEPRPSHGPWRIVIAVNDGFIETGHWSSTKRIPAPTGHVMIATSTSRATMRVKSITGKVPITITARNVNSYSTLRNQKSNTWRPSIGIAGRTTGSAIQLPPSSHGRLTRTDAVVHVDLQVRSRPAIALQIQLRSPHLRELWVRF